MANTGVRGTIRDDQGTPLPDLWVEAYDVEAIARDQYLSKAKTDSNGAYNVTYSKWSYGLESKPDLRLQVRDAIGRLLYESEEFPGVTADTFDAPAITIPRSDLSGWLVTLNTGTPTLLSQNNYIRPLIDNKLDWEELTTAIQNAAQYIHCSQLYLDVGNVYTLFRAMPQAGQAVDGDRPEEALSAANLVRGAAVKILLNDFRGLPYPFDTAGKAKDYFSAFSATGLEVKLFRADYNQAMHAKFTVIDGKLANMNASPILQEYFDDTTHTIKDPRRGDLGWSNAIQVPVHDVSVLVKGPVLDDVNQTFNLLWKGAGGSEITVAPHTPPTEPAAHSVQIVRTLPGHKFGASTDTLYKKGELGILEAYQRAIAQAQDYIYIENQYVTEETIVKSLAAALGDTARPNLQIIMLVNNKVDAPFYNKWQKRRFKQLIKEAESIGARNRLGIYTLWSHEPNENNRIIRNYVHSKVGIVDGKWATIGSANLDGQGIILSQHVMLYTSKDDVLEERACEVNTVVYNGVDGQPGCTVPDELRRNLWKEHLGIGDINDTQLTNRPAGGWLSLWQNMATAKLNNLKNNPPTGHAARILEWREPKDPEKYLKALGISKASLKQLKIMEKFESFSFSKKKWVS